MYLLHCLTESTRPLGNDSELFELLFVQLMAVFSACVTNELSLSDIIHLRLGSQMFPPRRQKLEEIQSLSASHEFTGRSIPTARILRTNAGPTTHRTAALTSKQISGSPQLSGSVVMSRECRPYPLPISLSKDIIDQIVVLQHSELTAGGTLSIKKLSLMVNIPDSHDNVEAPSAIVTLNAPKSPFADSFASVARPGIDVEVVFTQQKLLLNSKFSVKDEFSELMKIGAITAALPDNGAPLDVKRLYVRNCIAQAIFRPRTKKLVLFLVAGKQPAEDVGKIAEKDGALDSGYQYRCVFLEAKPDGTLSEPSRKAFYPLFVSVLKTDPFDVQTDPFDVPSGCIDENSI